MNKQQKACAIARARVEAITEIMNENEARFLRERGITNEDGSTPERLYQIKDDDVLERECKAFYQSPLNLSDDLLPAREELRQAEEALIDYGLSIVTPDIAAVLQKGRTSLRIRQRLLEAAFHLDTRTVPKHR